jgi:hypothetical protein
VDHFEEVTIRTGPDTCAKCRKELARHDRITEVKLVAGVGTHPSAAGRCLYVSEAEEYAHMDCADAPLASPFLDIPRSRLIVTTEIESLGARVPDYICARCKEKLVRGDRVVPVVLVEGIGRDPDTLGKAVQCSHEYEMTHLDCRDPQLKGGT